MEIIKQGEFSPIGIKGATGKEYMFFRYSAPDIATSSGCVYALVDETLGGNPKLDFIGVSNNLLDDLKNEETASIVNDYLHHFKNKYLYTLTEESDEKRGEIFKDISDALR